MHLMYYIMHVIHIVALNCRYVIKKQEREATSTNGDPKDQLSPKHDLEGPSVVFGRRSRPRDQGVAWGEASQPGKLTVA